MSDPEGLRGRVKGETGDGKSYGECIFVFLIIVLLGVFIYLGFGYRPKPRLVPLIVALPAFILAIAQFYLSCRKIAVKTPDGRKDQKEEKEGPGERSVTEIWLWLVLFVAGAALIGLLPASLIFLFCFLRFFSGKGWLRSAVISGVFFSAIYLLFHVLLEKL